MVCFDQLQLIRHISATAIMNIVRYTNPQEYELIIVDCSPKYPLKYDYQDLWANIQIIELPEDPGYYAAMNIGAEKATGEYICFIENDVFVSPNWLPTLRFYLENDSIQAVFPNQMPCDYSRQQEYETLSFEDGLGKGAWEQGLVLLKKTTFDDIGGWDKNLPKGFGWKNFYNQLTDHNFGYKGTCKTTVTHLTGITYFA